MPLAINFYYNAPLHKKTPLIILNCSYKGRVTMPFDVELENMRGRSWASSRASSGSSEVERLMQEQRSRDAKNANATLVTTHCNLSYDQLVLTLLSLLLLLLLSSSIFHSRGFVVWCQVSSFKYRGLQDW